MTRISPSIEGMRCGAEPARDYYEPPFDPEAWDDATRTAAAELRAMHGRHEDRTPRVAMLSKSGMVYAGAGPLTKVLPCECGDHLPGGTIKGSRAAAECLAKARAARDSEPAE
jgi:hypothetical protein